MHKREGTAEHASPAVNIFEVDIAWKESLKYTTEEFLQL